jgi:exopolysaccharide/PEP-CTERM locus tyrosine autokinase
MSPDNKENNRPTITRLVNDEAVTASDKDSFFNHGQDSESGNDVVPAENAKTVSLFNENTGEELSGNSDVPAFSRQNIPVLKHLRDAHMLVSGSGLGPAYFDEYRRIKRPLLSNAFGKTASLVDRGNLILVTSSLPGEGKTHTSINLALSIAHERDHTVLLVDCDIARQGASKMLGVENRPGLADVLEHGHYAVGDVLLNTEVHNFTLLPAGTQTEYLTELLASQRMSSIVDEIVSRYDDRVIIFDGPPLLPTPESQILVSLVGQITIVVEAGKTPQDVVREALEMIPEDKAVGLVMNKSEGVSSRSGYYYGYYGSEDGKSS